MLSPPPISRRERPCPQIINLRYIMQTVRISSLTLHWNSHRADVTDRQLALTIKFKHHAVRDVEELRECL